MSDFDRNVSMCASRSGPLRGTVEVPGDKSISHRSLILGALTVGETTIEGLLEGQDVLDTAEAMRAFGATVARDDVGKWSVSGVGVGGFAEPEYVINCGNSGTAVRLIMGAMATTPITATFQGDRSLNERPMGRVIDPLTLFGARCVARSNQKLPITISGATEPMPVHYTTPIPSAQIKSAVLLAGLNAPGQTTVIEPRMSRDHTERMLRLFGVQIDEQNTDQGRAVSLVGQPELQPQEIVVPRDPSSAAFPICAALIIPDSYVVVPGLCVNPTRSGLLLTLQEMGADLRIEDERDECGEIVADIHVRYTSDLRGVTVPPERVVCMIDEYPILSVVAAFAKGRTEMSGVGELRVKESDRLAAMTQALQACGVDVADGPDWWHIDGVGPGAVSGGMMCHSYLDHRIAMSCLVMGLASQNPITVDDVAPISTSFPGFVRLMRDLGADIQEVNS